MTPDKPKASNAKTQPAPAKPAAAKPTVSPVAAPLKPAPTKGAAAPMTAPPKPPPLFRPVDWLVFGVVAVLLMVAYSLTRAPNLTLQDSGEEAVASMYAGVPHPPGYPIWTIVTYCFTKLIPYSNIAWRVSIASSLAAALASALIALMVSRGSSMFLESIEEFKNIDRSLEKMICFVSGFVSGLLIGFNGFLWSQADIVEVYPLSTLSLAGVMICLMRWIYAPHQHRYLYLSWFLYGVCFNNHQSLLVIAVSMEVVVALAQPRLGRDLFLGNVIIWILGLIGKEMGYVPTLKDNPPLMAFYCVIGIGSLIAFVWLWFKTRQVFTAMHWGMICFFAFLFGAMFYFYMPIASMTNPPLNWGYPRTVAGFFHALTRGQYERIHPTNNWITYFKQMWYITGEGAVEEFNVIYLLLAFIPFFFAARLLARERCWLWGVLAFYVMLGPGLLWLLNPAPDRQSVSLNKVFFTPSHSMISMFVGYGLTFLAAMLVTQYERFRKPILIAFSVVSGFALFHLATTWQDTPYYILRYAAVFGFGAAAAATLLLLLSRSRVPLALLLAVFATLPGYSIMRHWSDNEQRGHYFGFWFGHDMFTPPFLAPDGSLSYDPKLRADLMKDPDKAKLIYPEMDKDTILFGGTDPGRFAPTYMIFCESFIPPKDRTNPNFDRRDVYIITQNALADGTYLNYIRAQYFRSAQIDPPFFSELVRSDRERERNYRTNLLARMLLPLDHFFLNLGDEIEKERRTDSSMFKEADFVNLPVFCRALKQGGAPAAVSKYLYDHLSPGTQEMVKSEAAGPALAKALAHDLNQLMNGEYEANRRLPEMAEELTTLTNQMASLKETGKSDSGAFHKAESRAAELRKEVVDALKIVPFYETNRFKDVALSEYVKQFIAQNPQLHSRIRLSRLLLEESYPGLFAKSLGGVYPDREIYTPSNEDSQKCFADYMADAQERMKRNALKPGEDVRVVENRVQVSGQVAVMAINGLLTKVIFEHNPNSEFYVEESFPLDWMFPHLTPYGIIMKINRKPVPELTEEMVRRDHEFWSQYSRRLVGNWITYDTPISNICAFAEKVYVHHDYKGFTGDRRFIRDDDAQKAFSKLRSSIGGVYAWRIDNTRNELERQRAMKEAEFAFKQAFAFCPYSPEALYRFVNILLRQGRVEDALLMATTAKKLDPDNAGLDRLIEELSKMKKQQQTALQGQGPLSGLEAEYAARPGNVSNALQLANTLAQMGQTDRVRQIADALLTNAPGDVSAVYFTVQVYSQLHSTPKLEIALQNWVKVNPSPEAWLDLAAIKTALGKQPEALAAVRICLDINARRLAANPNASNLALMARSDERLRPLQALPEFQHMLATNR
jgi:tetratricopeptide (TPR) repeat protein